MSMERDDQARLDALGLFDAQWYRSCYPDVDAGPLSPWEHFLQYGVVLGRAPGPGFDPAAYLAANEDVARAGDDPLLHYLRQGHAERREGVAAWVKERAATLATEESSHRESGKNLDSGNNTASQKISRGGEPPRATRMSQSKTREGTQPDSRIESLAGTWARTIVRKLKPSASGNNTSSCEAISSVPSKWKKEAKLVVESGLFDWDWYLAEYADVAASGVNPLLHYLRHGGDELRDPGPGFDTGHYVSQDPEIRRSGMNPLVHYVREGARRGLEPRPMRQSTRWWETLSANEELPFDPLAALERLAEVRQVPTVIIPVYNAVNEVRACLASLEVHTQLACRIIVIDDASPDSDVARLLAEYRDRWPFECYRNPENLGFTKTVNRGIELAGHSDVVILNSDTRVTPGWLRRLRLAAYSAPRVGTVTPLSNNAGAFSVPEAGSNELPEDMTLEAVSRSLSQSSQRYYPRVPTGNGFCLYVRRACLDEVGGLDSEAFPRGYGEENDFCMRAGRQEWEHIIDDASYIHHVRSASFGDEKKGLIQAGRAVVNSRYPEYSSLVTRAFGGEALRDVRRRVVQVFRSARTRSDVKPRILYVISTRTGGTPQTNRDLMGALEDDIECLVLRCNSRVVTLELHAEGIDTPLERHVLDQPLEAFPHRSAEYDRVVASWLVRYDIELMHVRHIAWHGLGLLECAKALGVPTVFSFHDFYTVCPTVKLLDADQRFCGGHCTSSDEECLHELWPKGSLPPLKHRSIKTWQREFGQILAECDAFVTTTPSACGYLRDVYPFLEQRDFRVIPHGRNFGSMRDLAPAPVRNESLRVVFPGNISMAKGGRLIQALAECAPEHGLEIHLLGKVAGDVVLPDWVIQHGGYQRDEFLDRIAEIRPHIGGILSIWPETYCHTLTELWAAGVPVVGVDIGAVGDRLRQNGAGWLARSPAFEDVQVALQEAREPTAWQRAHQAVLEWQRTEGISLNTSAMSRRYRELYDELLTHRWRNPQASDVIIRRSSG
ncbi:glycosyltransferase [Halomonas elongata]|uniref:glycosyltransferase n=1 Tax=Halomonas elongata TaxID=2746 RepID=UPI003356E7F7